MMFRFGTIFVAGLIASQMAEAHPLHSQVTEIEWNGDSHRFEVAMKLDAAAIEDALSLRVGGRVRLESTESVHKLVVDYLADTFEIQISDTSTTGTVTWHGLELELHSVWLYFEYSPPFSSAKRSRQDVADVSTEIEFVPTQVRVRNNCVVDVRPQTSHFIDLRCGDLRLQGHCSRGTPWAPLQTRRSAMKQLPQLVD